MTMVARGLRRELDRGFQHRRVMVLANGRVFRGKLRLIGRNFVTLRSRGRLTTIPTRRIAAVEREGGLGRNRGGRFRRRHRRRHRHRHYHRHHHHHRRRRRHHRHHRHHHHHPEE